MTDQEILASYLPIYAGLDDGFKELLEKKPLMAHYTSIAVLEKILSEGEIWFSNPLFMNDLEEMRYGINLGYSMFMQSEAVSKACGSTHRFEEAKRAFAHYYSKFDSEHAFDVYVFCFSEHDPADNDGILSMWRAYGAQGNGAALVFNTDFLTGPNPGSPLLITKVRYETPENRRAWLQARLDQWCAILGDMQISDDKIYLATHSFFEIIKLTALFFKHHGFSEEKEWRIVYMPDRDINGLLKDRFSYIIGIRGIEPKLKFQLKPLAITPVETWKFPDIVNRIVLGPSLSSPLSLAGVRRMLTSIKRPELVDKVVASGIPLRPS